MPSLFLYIIGFIVLVTGLAMGATLLGIDRSWIIVGVVILIGIMLLSLSTGFRRR
mgnify:CR=1 FL=1